MITAIDTSVVVYLLENDRVYGKVARANLVEAFKNGTVVLSAILVAEFLSSSTAHAKALHSFLEETQCLPVTQQVAIVATDIRKKYPSLRLPDALHLATAIVHGADSFITNDTQLTKLGSIDELSIKPLA